MGSGRLGAREGQNRLKTWCLPPRGQHAKSLGTHGMQGGRERNSGGILEEGSWGCGLGPGPWRILRPTGRWVWRSILDSQHPLKHRDRVLLGQPGLSCCGHVSPGCLTAPSPEPLPLGLAFSLPAQRTSLGQGRPGSEQG